MSKVWCLFAVVLLLGAASAVEECVEKPCTREYNPVSVVDSASNCRTFPNSCFLENAVRCRRIALDVVCVKGDCQHLGEPFPCPGLD